MLTTSKLQPLEPYFIARNPMKTAKIVPVSTDYKLTKLEKLLWKKADRLAIINFILVILIRIFLSLLVIPIVCLGAIFSAKLGASEIVSIGWGIIGAMAIRLIIELNFGIETEAQRIFWKLESKYKSKENIDE